MTRNGLKTDWDRFVESVKSHFGPSKYEDPQGALSKLLQLGTVEDYQWEFKKLMNRVTDIPESLFISFYIYGLKLHLQRELLVSKPTRLGDTFAFAKITEAPLKGHTAILTGTTTKTVADVTPQRHKGDVHFPIDNGSTSNFIRPDVVEKMCLPIKSTKAFKVYIGSGESLLCESVCSSVTLHMKGVVPTTLPPHYSINHRIHLLPYSTPVNVRPYRYLHYQKGEIEKLVNEMLSQGIIRYSQSPFSSLVLLVKKKDESYCFRVDYWPLNAVTVKDKFLVPTADEMFDKLGSAIILTKLVLRVHYHQILVHRRDVYKMVFRTHDGHYGFLVMPFSLKNAPSTFEETMNRLFAPYFRVWEDVSMDFIIELSLSKGFTVVLVAVDRFSKYAQFGVLPTNFNGHKCNGNGIPDEFKENRMMLQNRKYERQVLVQCAGCSLEEATWGWLTNFQSAYPTCNLEDNVVFEEVGNVTPLVGHLGRGKETKKAPKWQEFFVMS
nr:retrotransposon-related protein [Tanacetum cinerariifolium]